MRRRVCPDQNWGPGHLPILLFFRQQCLLSIMVEDVGPSFVFWAAFEGQHIIGSL